MEQKKQFSDDLSESKLLPLEELLDDAEEGELDINNLDIDTEFIDIDTSELDLK